MKIRNAIHTVRKCLGLKEQSTTLDTAQEQNNSSLSIEREHIPETPFTIVGSTKDGYWLAMGNHRLSKLYKSKKEVHKWLKRSSWSLVTSVIIAMIHDREKIDKAYTRDTSIPPDEKSRQMTMNM